MGPQVHPRPRSGRCSIVEIDKRGVRGASHHCASKLCNEFAMDLLEPEYRALQGPRSVGAANRFRRVTGHWPWRLFEPLKKQINLQLPEVWQAGYLEDLSTLARSRQRYVDDDFKSFQDFMAEIIEKQPTNMRSNPPRLHRSDLKRAKEEWDAVAFQLDIKARHPPARHRNEPDDISDAPSPAAQTAASESSGRESATSNDANATTATATEATAKRARAPDPTPNSPPRKRVYTTGFPVKPETCPEPGPINQVLEAPIQHTTRELRVALSDLMKGARAEQMIKKSTLQTHQSSLDVATHQLSNTEKDVAKLDTAVERAESQHSDIVAAVNKAQDALDRLKSTLNPEDRDEKAILDKRVEALRRARLKQEDAAHKLDVARYDLLTHHSSSVARLKQDQELASALVASCQTTLGALGAEIEAVEIFQRIVSLGPSRLHYVLKVSGLEYGLDAAIQKYIREHPNDLDQDGDCAI